MVDLSPRAHRFHLLTGLVVALLVFWALVLTPMYTTEPLNQLQQIQQRGHLKVLTVNAASTYFQDANGANGIEYQLSRLFADFIGVELDIVVADQFDDIYEELIFNGGDIGAAGLSPQDLMPDTAIAFGPVYHEVNQQVLYRRNDKPAPRAVSNLEDGILEVIQGSSHQRLMEQLQTEYPQLSWKVNRDIATEELIELVDQGLADYILADSHDIALQRRFFPELRVAFNIGGPKQLRWAVKQSEDRSLLQAIEEFFSTIQQDGRLQQFIHRYYSHVENFNYSDIQTFTLHARERLPRYRDMFIREAEKQGLDWRLLAAIGYQESLWNPKAKSPTGVRGLMMLTQATAKHVKIKDRLDPELSIRGGAIYFKRVLAKIPKRIQQPDRNWLALASYNVGFGHLEDARKITQSNGGDADKWIDIKESLPLLGRKKWYQKTKHGYARGWEPVKYVENIRKYYELLVWMDSRQNGGQDSSPLPTESEELQIAPSL